MGIDIFHPNGNSLYQIFPNALSHPFHMFSTAARSLDALLLARSAGAGSASYTRSRITCEQKKPHLEPESLWVLAMCCTQSAGHAASLFSALGSTVGEQGQPECSQPTWSGLLSSTNAGRQGQGEEYNWLLVLGRSLLIRGSHFGVKTSSENVPWSWKSLWQNGAQQGM